VPLFFAAIVAARRGTQTRVITAPVPAPPLWQMLLEELVLGVRAALDRFARPVDRASSGGLGAD
jgi:hypothetical protein